MHLYKSGDKSRALCETCGGLVATTFAYRDVPFDDGSGVVHDILAGVCDGCGQVVSIPAQSTPAIRRAREVADIPLEVQLPAPALEILDAAAYRIDPQATPRFRKMLIAYYINRLAGHPGAGAALKDRNVVMRKRPRVKAPRRRLSLKLAPRTNAAFNQLRTTSGLPKTDLVLSVVDMIETDIVRPKKPRILSDLRQIAAVANA